MQSPPIKLFLFDSENELIEPRRALPHARFDPPIAIGIYVDSR